MSSTSNPSKAENAGKRWSPQELDNLVKQVSASLTIVEISEVLGRSPGSIRLKAYDLGLMQSVTLGNGTQVMTHPSKIKSISNARAKHKWEDNEIDWLRDNLNKGASYETLCGMLQRSANAIALKAEELGLVRLSPPLPSSSSSSAFVPNIVTQCNAQPGVPRKKTEYSVQQLELDMAKVKLESDKLDFEKQKLAFEMEKFKASHRE
jgi:hypothetical protein